MIHNIVIQKIGSKFIARFTSTSKEKGLLYILTSIGILRASFTRGNPILSFFVLSAFADNKRGKGRKLGEKEEKRGKILISRY